MKVKEVKILLVSHIAACVSQKWREFQQSIVIGLSLLGSLK